VATLRQVQAEERPASPDEQAVLARWSGWGSLPKVFDPADEEYGEVRTRLRALLSDREWAAASRNTLNAHYTSFEAADAIWRAVRRARFAGGRVSNRASAPARSSPPGPAATPGR
jgi:hypothetical protein